MKPTIQMLFDGEIYPWEQVVPDTEEYKENQRWRTKTSEKFEKQIREISTELIDRYEDIKYYQSVMRAIEMEEMFSYGFSLGLRIAAESLLD